uniref:Uncharacterized protein n=1 Tax=uncultured bacterium esnapd22 TaxID=1366604 RepID=S5UBX1_9BACT|nr:hypothetical protein [uncultured bacterium esnapd22]
MPIQTRGSLLLLLSLAGCGAAEGGAGFAARDSAGIAIATTLPSARLPAWTLDPQPALSIGAVDGAPETLLDDVQAALLRPDGGVVLANGGTGELRWYDSAGGHLRTAGREGSGPGEFLLLTALARGAEGRVHAWDATHLRVTTFTDDERLDGTRTVTADSLGGFVRLAGMLADRSPVLLDGSSPLFRVSERTRRDPMRIWIGEPAGTLRHWMTVPGPETYTWRIPGGSIRSPAPFGRGTQVAVGRDRLWVGDSDRYEIRAYTPGGRLERIVRRQDPPREVTPAETGAYRRMWRERTASNPQASGMADRAAAELPFPRTHPAFTALQLDADGNLWVCERDGDDGSAWTVYDAEGRPLGQIALPPRVQPLDVAGDRLAARWKDESDVEFVHVYRFTRAAPD